VTLASLLLLAGPAMARDRWQRSLDRGEILVYTRSAARGPEVVVKAVIDAAPERVWRLVSQCNHYRQTMLRIKAAREISRRDSEVICRVTVDMPFPYSDLTATTRAIHRAGPEQYSRRWELINGDYKVNRGSWVLTPYRGDRRRTLVVYRAQAVPKAWVPDWIRRKAQQSSLPDLIRHLRGQLRS